MSILPVFLQRKEGCAVEDCTALVLFFLFILHSGSLFILFAGLPALQPGDPFFKRGRSENFICGRATYFSWKGKEPGMPEPLIFGHRSMGAGRCLFSDTFRRASRPATRRPLLKKGSIRKLFCGWATYFSWKGEESGMPDPLVFGNRSMDTVRRPLCGVCAFVHGGRHPPKTLGLSEDASHLHDLKRLGLFRRDKVPARNTPDFPASLSRT